MYRSYLHKCSDIHTPFALIIDTVLFYNLFLSFCISFLVFCSQFRRRLEQLEAAKGGLLQMIASTHPYQKYIKFSSIYLDYKYNCTGMSCFLAPGFKPFTLYNMFIFGIILCSSFLFCLSLHAAIDLSSFANERDFGRYSLSKR